MATLICDRYCAYSADQGWDLVTGRHVRLSEVEDDVSGPGLDTLGEVFAHGREGQPRWITVGALSEGGGDLRLRIAGEARARGFVAIAVDVYLQLRVLLAGDLQDRSLVLLAPHGQSPALARLAFMEAAAINSRPHVLVTFDAPAVQTRLYQPPSHVREARAAYAHASRPPQPQHSQDVARHIARGHRAGEFVLAGRHAAAERLLRDVSGALARRKASLPAAHAAIALGRLLLERGRIADAEHAFGSAADLALASGVEREVACARIWQSLARTDAGQLTSAEATCRAALRAGGLLPDEDAWGCAVLARVLISQNRLEEAGATTVAAIDPDSPLFPFVAAMRVRMSMALGRVFEAGQLARALLTATEPRATPLGRVLALSTHVRFLLAVGDLELASQSMAALRSAVRSAHTPLRWSRARLLWVDAFRAAGREREAAQILESLQRMRRAAPPLLRMAIDRRQRGPTDTHHAMPAWRLDAGQPAAMTLVVAARDIEDDRSAVKVLLERVAGSVHTSRIDVCSDDAGPASIVLSVGTGLPTTLGTRVLEAGISLHSSAAAVEFGVPVRLGDRVVGAIVARWPADRACSSQARELLELASAIAAPRVEGMRWASRETARALAVMPELVGISKAVCNIRGAVARAATAPFAVCIEGESGVGKELIARAIHYLGPRRERRFCDVNCAALPDDLLESELFGHAKGAFTGAVADRAGLVEEADGGTLFLDEVVDLSARAQAKLLRVLQQHEIRRVGETFSRTVDLRVVSAANRHLHTEAAAGRFRQDLAYRLDVIRIHIPPLRERPEDIVPLAEHFWTGAAARVETRAVLGHGVLAALARYHWPGNVRELQNVLAALAVAAPRSGQIRPALLPAVITSAAIVSAARLADARAQFERRFVEVALARAGGRRGQAARDLGLSRQGLLKTLRRLGMNEETSSSVGG